MDFPPQVLCIMDRLSQGGYACYAVGGCTRDTLLGRPVHDWDLTTSALPQQIPPLFPDAQILETGLQHGTLTLCLGGMSIEVTTYRIDGESFDHRHPKSVSFTRNLSEDLCRRDFTINAIACRPGEWADPFDGAGDLRRRLIRCIGDPDRRFEEDGLRILRALRFSSQLQFSIHPATASAVHSRVELLSSVSPERIREELVQMLCGPGILSVLLEYSDVLGKILPEILPMIGLDQRNPHHAYSVWEHTARTVAKMSPDPTLRLAALFHDIGKPACFSLDLNGIGHFYGHPEQSVTLCQAAMERLRFDRKTIQSVSALVKFHDLPLDPSPRILRRRLSLLGRNGLEQLFCLKKADRDSRGIPAEDSSLEEAETLLEEILSRGDCFSLADLAVTGHDLLALGIPEGKQVGRMLQTLLHAVINGDCPNSREALLDFCQKSGIR